MPYKDPVVRRERGREAQRRFRAKHNEASRAAREAALASRPSWPVEDLAWAAGMFEGEGTVTISMSRGYSRSAVMLTNTDFEIVDFFQARWPGRVHLRKANPRHKPAKVWVLMANQVIGFLEDVGPYLRTTAERRKFALVLESQRLRWSGYEAATHAARMQEYADQVRLLNRKGPITPGAGDADGGVSRVLGHG
jgi:hypothetical protein